MKDNQEKLNKKQKLYFKAAISLALCVALMVLCHLQGGIVATVLIIVVALLLLYILMH